jgi:hypothetical protein
MSMFHAIRSLFSSLCTDYVPSLRSRMDAATSNFQLLSLRPYVEAGGRVNMNKPFVYPIDVTTTDEVNVDTPVYFKDAVGCADDIVYASFKAKQNTEVKAHGFDISLPAAMMEASRYTEAEQCKFIVFAHPIHLHAKRSSVVLENTAAPPDSKKVLLVYCTSEWFIPRCLALD